MSKRNIVTFAIIGVGVLLFGATLLRELPLDIEASLTQVAYPDKFEYPAYTALLKKYVTPPFVDYSGLCKSPELATAMNELRDTSPNKLASEADRLAYWINAYNLLVLKNICEKYPIESARDVGGNFTAKQFIVGGAVMSAEEAFAFIPPLAVKIDPLVMFLTSKGAVGFPPLLDHPITAANLKEDALEAAKSFINDRKNVYYDRSQNHYYLSPFFDMNRSIFESKYSDIYSLADEFSAKKINLGDVNMIKSPTLKFYWRLNDIRLSQP